jgi:hypothetical protein
MRRLVEMISWLSLVLLTAAPVLFYLEKISLGACQTMMLVATVVWFASASMWMGRAK